jgi:deoxycytidylate deaminase
MVNESSKALYFGKRFNLPHLVKYPFIHAEIDAVSKLWGKHRIEGDEKVVVVRLKKSGTSATARKILVPAIAKPCENCYNVLSALGIKKVWWTNENGEFEQARNSKNGLDNGR